jgi:hypothetical protein
LPVFIDFDAKTSEYSKIPSGIDGAFAETANVESVQTKENKL